MKTNLKKIMNLFLAFLMVLTVFVPLKSFADGTEAAGSGNGTTTLNFTKYSLDKATKSNQYDSKAKDFRTGGDLSDADIKAMWGADNVTKLKGVTFTAYKITKKNGGNLTQKEYSDLAQKYIELNPNKLTFADLSNKLDGKGYKLEQSGNPSDPTGEDGKAILNLANGASTQSPNYYVILENYIGKPVNDKKGLPIFVSLPQLNADGETIAKNLYFYPKNILESKDITKEKTVGNLNTKLYTTDDTSELTWYLKAVIPASYLKTLNYLRFEDTINDTTMKGYIFDSKNVKNVDVNYVGSADDNFKGLVANVPVNYSEDNKSAYVTLDSSKLGNIKILDKDITVYLTLKTKRTDSLTNDSLTNLPSLIINPIINKDNNNGFKLYYSPLVPTNPDNKPVDPNTEIPKDGIPNKDKPLLPATPPTTPPDSYNPSNDNNSPQVQLGGAKFKKVGEDGETGLKGAKFYVYRTHKVEIKNNDEVNDLGYSQMGETKQYLALDNGKYKWIDADSDDAANKKLNGATLVTLTSGEDGAFSITGLEPSDFTIKDSKDNPIVTIKNEYSLQEYEAPKGYDLAPDKSFTITAKSNGSDSDITQITDYKPFMPLTGGRGKVAFIGAGIVFLALAGYVYRKRRNEA